MGWTVLDCHSGDPSMVNKKVIRVTVIVVTGFVGIHPINFLE
jgi:hypothetical protein